MFDRVAPRYDLANTVLSFGQDAYWRRVAARAARPAGASILDVAAGTGALSRELALLGATKVVALDLSHRMLTAGLPRPPRIHLCNGDALRLPFADATFHVTTIAFGLRNLPDPEAGLSEFARVTRCGGRLVVLEFSQPTWAPFRRLYTGYLLRALPLVASALSPAPAAYRYLADSILRWPDAEGLAAWISRNGWKSVGYRLLTGGIVAMHYATREGGRLPPPEPSPAGS
ncbi:MAG: ubiquinone/menaquinone biosynthesis methyltransferase [Actinomycetota bacterium]|nr:ubiquinone/menaquinone biosynthesis methyltransferase [Actinomycetota bacterium]